MKKGKAMLICGKICSGKSWYTEQLRSENNAVVLSCDELVFALFDGDLGEKHDAVTERVRRYLSHKAAEILSAGTDVILEWGFWQREYRAEMRRFFESRGFQCQLHYIDISDEDWKRNISERNRIVSEGASGAYYVDEGLMQKLEGLFEVPDRDEADVWYSNSRA